MEDIKPDSLNCLSALVQALYRGARNEPPETFQDWALEQVKTIIPFDSAKWVTGSVQNGELIPHSLHLHRLPETEIKNYLANLKTQDPMLTKILSNPGKTFDLYDIVSRQEFERMDIYQNYARRVGIEQAVSTALVDDSTNLFNVTSLYRSDYGKPFSATERRLKAFISPILADARRQNISQYMSEPPASSPSAHAACDIRAVLHDSDARFLRLLQMEWPYWQGPVLPFNPEELLNGASESVCHGQHVTIYLKRWNNLVQLQMRERSAVDSLTAAELRIARYLTQGSSNKEIARELRISPKTVGHHLQHIYCKLGVHSRQQTIALLTKDLPLES